MHPQTTTTMTTGFNAQFIFANGLPARALDPERPALHVSPAAPIENDPIDSAERERQDSLAFLHALVMG